MAIQSHELPGIFQHEVLRYPIDPEQATQKMIAALIRSWFDNGRSVHIHYYDGDGNELTFDTLSYEDQELRLQVRKIVKVLKYQEKHESVEGSIEIDTVIAEVTCYLQPTNNEVTHDEIPLPVNSPATIDAVGSSKYEMQANQRLIAEFFSTNQKIEVDIIPDGEVHPLFDHVSQQTSQHPLFAEERR